MAGVPDQEMFLVDGLLRGRVVDVLSALALRGLPRPARDHRAPAELHYRSQSTPAPAPLDRLP
jgi:hypothetical protein